MPAATAIAAARPPATWADHAADIATRLRIAPDDVGGHLRTAVAAWNRNPRQGAAHQVQNVASVRARLEAAQADPTRRWGALADQLDPRLTTESDWPALAAMLQAAHEHGCDVHAPASPAQVAAPDSARRHTATHMLRDTASISAI